MWSLHEQMFQMIQVHLSPLFSTIVLSLTLHTHSDTRDMEWVADTDTVPLECPVVSSVATERSWSVMSCAGHCASWPLVDPTLLVSQIPIHATFRPGPVCNGSHLTCDSATAQMSSAGTIRVTCIRHTRNKIQSWDISFEIISARPWFHHIIFSAKFIFSTDQCPVRHFS